MAALIRFFTYYDFFRSVTKEFIDFDKGYIERFRKHKSLSKIFSNDRRVLRAPFEIMPNLYLETYFNIRSILKRVKTMLEVAGFEVSDVELTLDE